MIRKPIITAATPIAEMISEREHALRVEADSPIAELMKWSYDLSADSRTVSKEDHVPTVLQETTGQVLMEGMTGHSAAVDAEVTRVSKVIAEQLRYVKEEAKPLLDDIYHAAVSTLDDAPSLEVDIVEYDLPELYTSPGFASLMENYSDLDYAAVKSANLRDFPIREEKELMDLVATGSAAFDRDVISIINSHEPGWIVKVYESIFVNYSWEHTEWSSKLNSNLTVFKPTVDLIDDYLIIFLLSRGLTEHPHKEFGKPLSEFRNVLAAKARAAAVAMTLAAGEFIRARNSGTMVIRYETRKTQTWRVTGGVSVVRSLYHRFLDEGGKPEVVMGATLLTTDRPRNIKQFQDRSVELAGKYSVEAKRAEASRNASMGDVFKSQVSWELHDLITRPVKVTLPALAEYDVNEPGLWHSKVNAAVNAIRAKRWASEPYMVIRELLGKLVWPGTNIIDILTTVDTEMEKHSDLEPREAAYRATLRVLARHYLQFVSYERVSEV